MQHQENTKANDRITFGVNKSILEEANPEINYEILVIDKDGKLKERRTGHNTMTTAGKNMIADQILAAPTLAKVGWCAVGTGTPAATLLGAEIARVAFASKTRSGAVVTMSTTFNAGVATGNLVEAGLFDVVTANTVNMIASTTFASVNVGALDSVIVNWTITIN